jgi:hypothetical protein
VKVEPHEPVGADVHPFSLLEESSLTGEKFWLVGDIQKTHVLGHKIPMTKEVAVVILTQIEWVKQHYTLEENPKGWLFPALKNNTYRFLYGDPLNAKNVSRALDSLVKQYQIRDETGNLFHFKLHAFRHTKGMELVNNGMSLLMVQPWMAHASPEMTLIYAKIRDETVLPHIKCVCLLSQLHLRLFTDSVQTDMLGLSRWQGAVPCQRPWSAI